MRMHQYDPALADLVFDYMRDRLALDPVPLDHPGRKDKLDRALDGLIGPGATTRATCCRSTRTSSRRP